MLNYNFRILGIAGIPENIERMGRKLRLLNLAKTVNMFLPITYTGQTSSEYDTSRHAKRLWFEQYDVESMIYSICFRVNTI